MEIDIIIPSCKDRSQVQLQIDEIERTRGSTGKVIFTGLNTSASSNRNAGLRQSVSEYVMMVDDDIGGYSIEWDINLLKLLLAHPQYSMISPRLMLPDGSFGEMIGSSRAGDATIYPAYKNRMPSACILFKRDPDIFFDEGYIGSGFEDVDFIRQYLAKYPEYSVAISNTIRVIHLNERKNQSGKYFDHNYAFFKKKWGCEP